MNCATIMFTAAVVGPMLGYSNSILYWLDGTERSREWFRHIRLASATIGFGFSILVAGCLYL